MMKRFDPTASTALAAAATIVAGALLALSGGPGAPQVAYAVERAESASLPVNEAPVPVAQLVERAPVESNSPLDLTAQTLTAHLLVLDDRTGLAVETAVLQLDAEVQHISAPRTGPLTLEVAAAGQELQVGAIGFLPRTIKVDGEETLEVRLSRRPTLRGVVRAADGSPVPYARVQLIREGQALADEPGSQANRSAHLRRADVNGAYAFDALEPGTYQTSVEVLGVTHTSPPRELRDGEWAEADHRLVASSALVIRVEQPSGLPAERTRLLLQREGAAAPMSRYTNDRGEAEVRPLPTGSYQLTVQSAQGTAAPRAFTIEEADQGLVDLHIQLSSESVSLED